MLIASFDSRDIAKFGPKNEESAYLEKGRDISVDDCLRRIKEEITISGDGLSGLAEIHPAWIVGALENESPKIIGIILRWLPSRHVRYILEHLPKRVKMSLPKLVESFAVPTQILRLIRTGFEHKFSIPISAANASVGSFDEICLLKSDDLAVLFRDLGIHELAMAFQNIDQSGIRILLNRMSVSSARALQQRIKDTAGTDAALLKDARYTTLEVAMDQEDVERLLLEMGLASFSKAMMNDRLFSQIQLKLDPVVSYLFKRYIDQHVGVNKLAEERQAVIMGRLKLLSKAGGIDVRMS